AEELVGEAIEPLQRLAHIADATAAEVRQARKEMEEAQEAVAPAAALCDIVTACRTSGDVLSIDLGEWNTLKETIEGSAAHETARAALKSIPAFHFLVAFPEVF